MCFVLMLDLVFHRGLVQLCTVPDVILIMHCWLCCVVQILSKANAYCWLCCVVQILSKDSVTVAVDAVIYYRIHNPTMAITNVEDVHRSTRLLAQTTLRNILGMKSLSEILSDREHISATMRVGLEACLHTEAQHYG